MFSWHRIYVETRQVVELSQLWYFTFQLSIYLPQVSRIERFSTGRELSFSKLFNRSNRPWYWISSLHISDDVPSGSILQLTRLNYLLTHQVSFHCESCWASKRKDLGENSTLKPQKDKCEISLHSWARSPGERAPEQLTYISVNTIIVSRCLLQIYAAKVSWNSRKAPGTLRSHRLMLLVHSSCSYPTS